MDAIIRNRLKYTEPDYSKDWQYTTNSIATLVTKYIGTNTTVLTPNKIKKLPVVLQNSSNSSSGVFTNNRNITSVTFDDGIAFTNNSMAYTFAYCTKLTQAPNIPNNVTDMHSTFMYCNKLTQAPVIPNSVTNMANTFYSCSNLTQAPNIPNSVTSMAYTFRNCSNLIGSIIIRSENIISFKNCFYNTNASKRKKVYIPYKYANGVNTKTYNAAFNGSYGINGKNGVTVYDINTYTG